MATQIRETAFGQLTRRLSNNRWFRYPDEVDPTLWEKYLRDRESTTEEKHCRSSPSGADASSSGPEGPAGDGPRSVEDGQDVYLVDWYGPDDPENPINWPKSWKFLIAALVCLLNFVVYIASSLYVPGEIDFEADFGVTPSVAILGLSLFSIGYGFGPMLWSPMSEMPQLGRSGIYVWTLFVFVLLQLPTGFAVDVAMFLVFRTISGFVGSPTLATGGATITDVYGPARAAFGICIWASCGVCGPIFGPLIGGFVASVKGWRWTIWIYTWMCVSDRSRSSPPQVSTNHDHNITSLPRAICRDSTRHKIISRNSHSARHFVLSSCSFFCPRRAPPTSCIGGLRD